MTTEWTCPWCGGSVPCDDEACVAATAAFEVEYEWAEP